MFNPSGRVEKWEDHLSLMGPQDWLIGKGSGFRGSIGGEEITGFGMDNLLARLVWDFGLGGLTCFGIMLALLLRRGLRGKASLYKTSYLAIVLIMLVHNVTHELFFIMKTSDLFWFLLGYFEFQMTRVGKGAQGSVTVSRPAQHGGRRLQNSNRLAKATVGRD
jgi:hypothetical protein